MTIFQKFVYSPPAIIYKISRFQIPTSKSLKTTSLDDLLPCITISIRKLHVKRIAFRVNNNNNNNNICLKSNIQTSSVDCAPLLCHIELIFNEKLFVLETQII